MTIKVTLSGHCIRSWQHQTRLFLVAKTCGAAPPRRINKYYLKPGPLIAPKYVSSSTASYLMPDVCVRHVCVPCATQFLKLSSPMTPRFCRRRSWEWTLPIPISVQRLTSYTRMQMPNFKISYVKDHNNRTFSSGLRVVGLLQARQLLLPSLSRSQVRHSFFCPVWQDHWDIEQASHTISVRENSAWSSKGGGA